MLVILFLDPDVGYRNVCCNVVYVHFFVHITELQLKVFKT